MTSAHLAIWGLTVMTPGGVAIVPHPALGEHPRDLLPNRNLVLWPYTDMSDPRWHFLESLGPLTQMDSRQSVEHVERWELRDGPSSLDTNSEEALDELVRPILEECEQPG